MSAVYVSCWILQDNIPCIYKDMILISTFLWMVLDSTLLSDAESSKDQVQDVVGGGDAGDFVERAEGSVEIKEEHLVGDAGGYGVGSG